MLRTIKKFLACITAIATLAFTSCYAAPGGTQSSQQDNSAPQESKAEDDKSSSDEEDSTDKIIQVHPLRPSPFMNFEPFSPKKWVPIIPLGDSPPLISKKGVTDIVLGESPPLTKDSEMDDTTGNPTTASCSSMSSHDEKKPEYSESSASSFSLGEVGIELPGSTEKPSIKTPQMLDLNVKAQLFRRLLTSYSGPYSLVSSDVRYICTLTSELLKKEPPILYINNDPIVVGDLHGNFNAARVCCEKFLNSALPAGRSIIFLGDYVDRGPQSIKTLMLLLNLKRLFPDKVFLLRGNHEARGQEDCDKTNTLFKECNRDFANGEEVYNLIQETIFNNLSVAAVVNNKYLCVHGGIPCEWTRGLITTDTISRIKKPFLLNPSAPLPEDEKLIYDILWRDPLPEGESPFTESPRGPDILYFSFEETKAFLDKWRLKQIIRGHEWVLNSGYKLDLNGTVITIFSSPHYGSSFFSSSTYIGGGTLDIIGEKTLYSPLPSTANEDYGALTKSH